MGLTYNTYLAGLHRFAGKLRDNGSMHGDVLRDDPCLEDED